MADTAQPLESPIPGNWPIYGDVFPADPAEAGIELHVTDLLADVGRCFWPAVLKAGAAAVALWRWLPSNRPPPMVLPRAKVAENKLTEAELKKLYELKEVLR